MKIELVHSFDVPRDVYEKNINHPTLLKMCEGKLPYLKSRTLVESKAGPGPNEHFWRFRCEADYKMPEAARKVIGDRLGWFEDTTFDKKDHMVRFKIVPDMMAGRYKCEGDQVFADIDGKSMDRIMTVDLTVNFPIFGGLVERHVAEKLRETYAVELEIQKEFFRQVLAGKV